MERPLEEQCTIRHESQRFTSTHIARILGGEGDNHRARAGVVDIAEQVRCLRGKLQVETREGEKISELRFVEGWHIIVSHSMSMMYMTRGD